MIINNFSHGSIFPAKIMSLCLKRFFPTTILILFFLSNTSIAFPEEQGLDERHFFSYKRFFLKTGILGENTEKGGTRADIERFVAKFNGGLYAMSAGEIGQAKEDFLKARSIWPEYFGSDFMLARAYEESGDVNTAARYYKSYLNKLKTFYSGGYRISAPMIRRLMEYDIEPYSVANSLVRERLSRHGISVEAVRPAIFVPKFIFYIIAFLIGIIAYISTIRWILPYHKEQKRIKNPPEGFWICKYCHTTNPELNKVCEHCNRRPG